MKRCGCPDCKPPITGCLNPLLDEVARLREGIEIAFPALEGYLQGESGLPFDDPYRAARVAAEALHAALEASSSEPRP